MTNVVRFLKQFNLEAFVRFASFVVTSQLLVGFASAQSQKPIFLVTPEVGSHTSFSALADFNGDESRISHSPSKFNFPAWHTRLERDSRRGRYCAHTIINTSVCDNIGTGPFAVGDVNNDKKPDIVMACTGYIAVLFGNGDGTFQAPVFYPAQSYYPPALVDLNGDGYLDLAVVTSSGNTASLTMFLNKGSAAPGTFGAPENYSLGAISGPISGPVSGDFNGDGKRDLLVLTDTTLIVFDSNGDGTLQAALRNLFPRAHPL